MELQDEIWKDIPSFEGVYQISNLGRVKSLSRTIPTGCGSFKSWKEKIMKTSIDNNGYMVVGLCKLGKRKMQKVHRLVIESFIENPDNLPMVNHIDGCKTNNKSENLEWCSASYNIIHAYRLGLKHPNRVKIRYSAKGYYKTKEGKFKSQIIIDKKQIYLGTFATAIEAINAYKSAVKKHLNIII